MAPAVSSLRDNFFEWFKTQSGGIKDTGNGLFQHDHSESLPKFERLVPVSHILSTGEDMQYP